MEFYTKLQENIIVSFINEISEKTGISKVILFEMFEMKTNKFINSAINFGDNIYNCIITMQMLSKKKINTNICKYVDSNMIFCKNITYDKQTYCNEHNKIFTIQGEHPEHTILDINNFKKYDNSIINSQSIFRNTTTFSKNPVGCSFKSINNVLCNNHIYTNGLCKKHYKIMKHSYGSNILTDTETIVDNSESHITKIKDMLNDTNNNNINENILNNIIIKKSEELIEKLEKSIKK